VSHNEGLHRMRLFKNSVRKHISGSKRQNVIDGRMKRHSNKVHDLYTSPDITFIGDKIKTNEMGRACCTCRVDERCTQAFGGKT
jgi:hypothetical protein